MPLVRISLLKGKPASYRRKVGDAIHRDLVIVQITLSTGRSLSLKRSLYRTIAERLGTATGLRPEDVWINLVEVAKESWSFGNGVASYAPEEAALA